MMKERRHRRIRSKLSGTAARPRLAVHRTLRQIYAQVIDDERGTTICAASSLAAKSEDGGNLKGAKAVGADIAKLALAQGISAVAFDRAGFRYHGRVKALADAAREAGLKF